MAAIYPNFKDRKIISFKFKAYLGKDENGKQIFKCKTWIPEKQMSTKKLKTLAEKEAILWEHELSEQFSATMQTPVSSSLTFEDFVNDIWFPIQMNEDKCRTTTISFHRDILKITFSYMEKISLSEIDSKKIKNYLDYLKNVYKTRNNKSLFPKTIRHHYGTLNLIFSYAEKIGYISTNPVKKVDVSKLPKHKVNALTKSQAITFMDLLCIHFLKASQYNNSTVLSIFREPYGL